jgi:hypothetical protein
MVEIPYSAELAKLFPPAGKTDRQTRQAEVVETDKSGAITLRRPQTQPT